MQKLKQKGLIKLLCVIIIISLTLSAVALAHTLLQRRMYPRAYSEYVEVYSETYGVPEYIVYSVIKVESNFCSDAVSPVGACGLMQLMPSTYEWLAELLGNEPGNIFDPHENIKHGVYYLSLLYSRYNDWKLALCAYNAGMGNVDKWLEDKRLEIPFEETRNYVKKLKVVAGRYQALYYG